MKAYCEAFFFGCDVKVVRPGDTLTNKISERKTEKKKIPEDFLEEHKITSRES